MRRTYGFESSFRLNIFRQFPNHIGLDKLQMLVFLLADLSTLHILTPEFYLLTPEWLR
jgi:hypothetical protein